MTEIATAASVEESVLEESALRMALVVTSEMASMSRYPLAVIWVLSRMTSASDWAEITASVRLLMVNPLESRFNVDVALNIMLLPSSIAPVRSMEASESASITSLRKFKSSSTSMREPNVPSSVADAVNEMSSAVMVTPELTVMVSALMIKSAPGMLTLLVTVTLSVPSPPLMLSDPLGVLKETASIEVLADSTLRRDPLRSTTRLSPPTVPSTTTSTTGAVSVIGSMPE